jgi:hypothetical protein
MAHNRRGFSKWLAFSEMWERSIPEGFACCSRRVTTLYVKQAGDPTSGWQKVASEPPRFFGELKEMSTVRTFLCGPGPGEPTLLRGHFLHAFILV